MTGSVMVPLLDSGQCNALARLVGPAGIRTIESALLGVLRSHIAVIKGLLIKHAAPLLVLAQQAITSESLHQASKDLHACKVLTFFSVAKRHVQWSYVIFSLSMLTRLPFADVCRLQRGNSDLNALVSARTFFL